MIFLLWVVIGAMVGWSIGEFMKNDKLRLASHIAIGIIGALIGGYFSEFVNIPTTGSLIMAIIGSTGLVFASRMVQLNGP